jgi:methylenetetrahydrofolate--tRNA-(uracil-5-)-methyltransferase
LAVDRELFSQEVTNMLSSHPNIEIIREELLSADENTIIAAGPLASGGLMDWLHDVTGEQLHFVDAISPVISADSIDMEKAFFAGRYGKGGDDYLNLPMTEVEYDRFYDALMSADTVRAHLFEDEKVFEKCMPVEVMAARGKKTLLFGPMRPVGLRDKEGHRPFAVVQLRHENREGSAYNIVGFQTKMTIGAQKEVLKLIPGLENAEFLRYGAIHRNTYINAPVALNADFSLKGLPGVYMAGQITGVEGYLESAASGIMAALFMERSLCNLEMPKFPAETAFGALISHIKGEFGGGSYSPGSFHFGMLPLPEERIRNKEERKLFYHQRGLGAAKMFLAGQ